MVNCQLGYLLKRLFKKPGAHNFDAIFLCVIADLRISKNKSDRARSHRSYGMVTCEVIRDNPRYTGKRLLEGVRCIRLDSSSSETDVGSEKADDNSENTELCDDTQTKSKAELVRLARRNNLFASD
jgi:hypothetical protein